MYAIKRTVIQHLSRRDEVIVDPVVQDEESDQKSYRDLRFTPKDTPELRERYLCPVFPV